MFFGKRKKEIQTCNHKWKDFPWYIVIGEYDTSKYPYDDLRYTIRVKEPYVCIKCKKRRDELLYSYECDSKDYRDKKVEELRSQYSDKIKPIVEVEDMVLDEQLVDRDYLKLIEQYYHPEDQFAGIDLFAEIRKAKMDAGVPVSFADIGGIK